MAIIGNNNLEPDAVTYPTQSIGLDSALFSYTAVAGDYIDGFYVYAYSWNANCYLYMAAYSVTAGRPDVRLAAEVGVLIQVAPPRVWNTTAVNQPLVAGTEYILCFRGVNAVSGLWTSGVPWNGSRDGTIPLPAVWTHTAADRSRWSCYANVANSGAPTSIFFPCRAQLIT